MRRPVNWRTARSVACLCLPTVAVVALSVLFFVDKVPEIEKAERNRVKAEYRERALELRQNPGDGRFGRETSLPAAWRGSFAGKMAPGRWGYVPVPLKSFTWVWYEDGSGVAYLQAPYVRERDYRTMFLVFGIAFLFVLVGVTCVGVKYFVDYVNARDDFLAAAAHDLATPLVGMRLAIGRDDASAKVLVERMLRLVANIREFLRLGGRRPAPESKPVDLVAAYREAYALFRDDYRDLFDGEDVALDAPVEGLFARGDGTLIVQILWNLLGNDLKYAAPHGRVRARIFAEEGEARVEIADEGPGLTPREMGRVFDRYYRAKTVMESGKGGFGIGLCTAREFARAMGGDLTVRAASPRGSIFTLSLPQSLVGS